MLSGTAYYLGLKRSVAVAGVQEHVRKLHSRPPYYGAMTALWCGIPALILYACWLAFEPGIITGMVVVLAAVFDTYRSRIIASLRAR